MRRHRFATLALIVPAALATFQLTGCTAINFGIGALVDTAAGKGPPSRLVMVKPGTSVTMWTNDGRKLHGKFLGSQDSLGGEAPVYAQASVNSYSAVPLRGILNLRTDRGVEQVPIQDVRRVSVPMARGKVIGLVTGVAADGMMIFIAWQVAESFQ